MTSNTMCSMQMSLAGKLEADVEIKSNAAAFHDVLGCRPQQTTKASPGKVLACDIKEGDWGNSGSVIDWNYVHEGKAMKSKAKVSAIDNVNKSTTYTIFEGDVMEGLKSFVVTVKATPKVDGKGSVVHWTMAYEKLNGNVAAPSSMLDCALNITKDVDAHLVSVKAA